MRTPCRLTVLWIQKQRGIARTASDKAVAPISKPAKPVVAQP